MLVEGLAEGTAARRVQFTTLELWGLGRHVGAHASRPSHGGVTAGAPRTEPHSGYYRLSDRKRRAERGLRSILRRITASRQRGNPSGRRQGAGACPRKVRSIPARSQRPFGSRCGVRNSYDPCYHLLFAFDRFGGLERCVPRPGTVRSICGWDRVISSLRATEVLIGALLCSLRLAPE